MTWTSPPTYYLAAPQSRERIMARFGSRWKNKSDVNFCLNYGSGNLMKKKNNSEKVNELVESGIIRCDMSRSGQYRDSVLRLIIAIWLCRQRRKISQYMGCGPHYLSRSFEQRKSLTNHKSNANFLTEPIEKECCKMTSRLRTWNFDIKTVHWRDVAFCGNCRLWTECNWIVCRVSPTKSTTFSKTRARQIVGVLLVLVFLVGYNASILSWPRKFHNRVGLYAEFYWNFHYFINWHGCRYNQLI